MVEVDKIEKIRPGESIWAQVSVPIKAADGTGYIHANYDDEYGNTYETRVLIDLKKLKVLKQEYRIVKIVKEVGDNIPKLVIDENSLQMTMNAKKAEIHNQSAKADKIIKEK